MSISDLNKIRTEKLIHLTTTGRRTNRPHTVEIWFAVGDGRIYLSHEGERTDWMKNITRNGHVSFEIGGKHFVGKAHQIQDHTDEARKGKVALYEKYYGKATAEVIEDWFSLSRLLAIEAIDVRK